MANNIAPSTRIANPTSSQTIQRAGNTTASTAGTARANHPNGQYYRRRSHSLQVKVRNRAV
jgi:hypothetical protein